MESFDSLAVAVESASVVERYAAFCRTLQVVPHPAILTFLRLHLAELRPEPYRRDQEGRVGFSDADMFAFCDFVLRSRQPCPTRSGWPAGQATAGRVARRGAS